MLRPTAVRHRIVAVPGAELHVALAGPVDGPPVVLLHGFPETWWSWRYQIGPLADAGWRVIAPDLRGYGASSRHGPFDLVIVANGAHSALRQALAEHVLRDALYPWGAIWCLADDLHHRFHHDLEQRYRRAREMCGVLPVGTLPGQAPAARKLSVYWSVRTTDLDAVLAGGIAPVHDAIGRLWPDAERLTSAMTDLSAWRRASYRDVVLAKPHRGRVVLIGDAAHGMSPQLGQGANMALLDAQALSQALERGTTIASALDDYARTRAAHLAIYQFLSRWLTPLFQSDLDALAWWRDLLFLPLSRMPIARGESLKILTGLKRGWFGRLPL